MRSERLTRVNQKHYNPGMNPLVSEKLNEVRSLCRRHRVRALHLVGSATDATFDPSRSDLDFLVEFEPHQRRGLRDVYFDLAEALERLFGRPVDLIEVGCINNPGIKDSIEASKVPLYAAA